MGALLVLPRKPHRLYRRLADAIAVFDCLPAEEGHQQDDRELDVTPSEGDNFDFVWIRWGVVLCGRHFASDLRAARSTNPIERAISAHSHKIALSRKLRIISVHSHAKPVDAMG